MRQKQKTLWRKEDEKDPLSAGGWNLHAIVHFEELKKSGALGIELESLDNRPNLKPQED